MDLHSTDELIGMIEALDRPATPLLNLFFAAEQLFESEEVHLDRLDRARRLAPFVSPVVAGKAERARGYATSSFRPAYVKPKHVVEPSKALKRRAGEKLTGEMGIQERYDLAVADNLRIEDEQITRREEHMAAEILRSGKVVVEGEDFPKQEVDFGRAASLTKLLAGASRWGEAGISPLKNLRSWGTEVSKKSGAHPHVVIMDPLAAEILLDDPDLDKKLDNRRQMGGQAQKFGATSGAQGRELVYLGELGQFELWQYSNIYTADDGTELNMMPDYTVLMGNPKLAEGVRCYGAIQDKKALRAMSRFPKEWEQEDPSLTYTMVQSAPLPVLGRPDATICVTVR